MNSTQVELLQDGEADVVDLTQDPSSLVVHYLIEFVQKYAPLKAGKLFASPKSIVHCFLLPLLNPNFTNGVQISMV